MGIITSKVNDSIPSDKFLGHQSSSANSCGERTDELTVVKDKERFFWSRDLKKKS